MLYLAGKNPYLKVFSEDKTLGGVTLQLKVIVTVIGDTTFDNTAIVKIVYQKLPQAQKVAAQELPRFDSKSRSEKTL